MVDNRDGERRLRALGVAVRKRRSELGVSQEELSFRSELDRTYISGVERGVRNPTIKSLWRISDALETQPSVLLHAAECALEGAI